MSAFPFESSTDAFSPAHSGAPRAGARMFLFFFLLFFLKSTAYFNRDKHGYRSGTPGSRKHGGTPTSHFTDNNACGAPIKPVLVPYY